SLPKIPVPGLDKLVMRMPPVVAKPTAEAAVFSFNWLSATGSGIFVASIVAGLVMGYSLRELLRVYWKTLKLVRFSLLTIAALMAAANSSGGVMGKMIDAQSIVVASTATRWYGHEGDILRYVFFHSLALATLVGILVLLQAYVFTSMIVK